VLTQCDFWDYKRKAKNTARAGWKTFKSATHHRYGTFSKPKIDNVVKDVKMLKSLINVEKKTANKNNYGSVINVAQYSNASGATATTGAQIIDITPTIAQGITNTTRNGNSIKLTTACFNLQAKQMLNTTNAVSCKYSIVMIPDNSNPSSEADILTQYYENNGFTGIVDSYSNRDSEFYTKFRVLKSGTFRVSGDTLGSQNNVKQLKCPMKLGFHQKYNTDASTVTTKNRILLIVTGDTGSVHGTLQTGLSLQYSINYWYTDN
jgi:hypothetical protein